MNLPVHGVSRRRIVSDWESLLLQPAPLEWIALSSPVAITFPVDVSISSLFLVSYNHQILSAVAPEVMLITLVTCLPVLFFQIVSDCVARKRIYPCYQVYLRTISRPDNSMSCRFSISWDFSVSIIIKERCLRKCLFPFDETKVETYCAMYLRSWLFFFNWDKKTSNGHKTVMRILEQRVVRAKRLRTMNARKFTTWTRQVSYVDISMFWVIKPAPYLLYCDTVYFNSYLKESIS